MGILLGVLASFLVIIGICVVVGRRKIEKEKTDIVVQIRRHSIQTSQLVKRVSQMHLEPLQEPQSSSAAESSMVESSQAESSVAGSTVMEDGESTVH